MVFVLGVLFKPTAPLASLFVALQHNVSSEVAQDAGNTPGAAIDGYTVGRLDMLAMFFYTLISIVVNGVIKELLIDKIDKKLNLSKSRHSKFVKSTYHACFYLISIVWGSYILYNESLLSRFSSLWADYPNSHARLTFMTKLFFILQVSSWLHAFPALYLQKVKRDEWIPRIALAVAYIIFIGAAYVTNFTRIALVLLVVHYTAEFLGRLAIVLHATGKEPLAVKCFGVYNSVFVLCRLVSVVLALLVFSFGLAHSQVDRIDVASGNFNTLFVRLGALGSVLALQSWMMWNFINLHMKRRKEQAAATAVSNKKVLISSSRKDKSKAKDKKNFVKSFSEISSLPEADQNSGRSLRQRK